MGGFGLADQGLSAHLSICKSHLVIVILANGDHDSERRWDEMARRDENGDDLSMDDDSTTSDKSNHATTVTNRKTNRSQLRSAGWRVFAGRRSFCVLRHQRTALSVARCYQTRALQVPLISHLPMRTANASSMTITPGATISPSAPPIMMMTPPPRLPDDNQPHSHDHNDDRARSIRLNLHELWRCPEADCVLWTCDHRSQVPFSTEAALLRC